VKAAILDLEGLVGVFNRVPEDDVAGVVVVVVLQADLAVGRVALAALEAVVRLVE
jgi:hypothetical protein